MGTRFNFRLAAAWCLSFGSTQFAFSLTPPLAAVQPVVVGELPAVLREASGVAISRRDPNVLWTHNDRGATPILYAIDRQGALRATVTITGAGAQDWEDVATFVLDGQACILIADTGDNFLRRADTTLYLIAEPDLAPLSGAAQLSVPVQARIPVRFPDGPQDCEAVAVDAERREILLISKRSAPPKVYRLPLALQAAAAASTPKAELVLSLNVLRNPRWWQMFNVGTSGLLRSWPTALDISSDGRRAVLLTYGEPHVFERADGEAWAEAFARAPRQLPPHRLAQAEAVAFSADGNQIFVTTEGFPAPLLRYDLD